MCCLGVPQFSTCAALGVPQFSTCAALGVWCQRHPAEAILECGGEGLVQLEPEFVTGMPMD